jgi:hypothetical protein
LPKRIPIALLLAGGICLSGCSKTQDTAPATRVFGSPPVIESVNLASGGTTGQAICDYGPVIKNAFCADGEQFAEPFPAILVTVNYTEATFSVKVSDPESTASNSDILLVSASYQTTKDSTPTEVSLVMLDDGGSNKFTFQGRSAEPWFEDCASQTCPCLPANYNLDTNDPIANDGVYTRGFSILSSTFHLTSPTGITPSNTGVVLDCIASAKRQFPALASIADGPVAFKIEVVDKEGNLTAWPTKPTAVFAPTTYTCTGDDCGCCFLLSSNPTECSQKSGLPGAPGSGFENGFCKSF